MNYPLPEELQEIFTLLEASKLKPQLADTPVTYIDTGVKAGIPSMPGDVTQGQYVMLPRELVGMNPTFVIDVIGDSMKDAGLLPGDRLQVQVGCTVHDGDIILISINGECTVKAYCEDELGEKWLVPLNEAYNAIQLTEEMEIRIIGRVISIMKEAPRTSYSEMMKSIKRTRGKVSTNERKITPEQVRNTLIEMGNVVKHGRQWYAVYRAMVDKGVLNDGDYSEFTDKVCELLPEHGHLPVASELRRMAIQSFRKPTALWERGDAPVSGQRFDDYLRVARVTNEKLRG